MLEISLIRESKKEVIESLKKRQIKDIDKTIDNLLKIDDNRKDLKKKLDDLLMESNKISKSIGILFKQGGKENEIESLKQKTTLLKKEISEKEEIFKNSEEQIDEILKSIPNVLYNLVKSGKNEEDNEIVFSKDINSLESKKYCHWDIAERLDLIDFKAGAKITGSGFLLYRGKGAILQRAMINYFLDKNIRAGYQEVIPPYVVNESSGFGTGQLPDKEGQMYKITEDNLYLIPTAEVPVTNIYRDVILDEKNLPIKLTAYSPCFRREAGSYGKDVKGLNRLHQFDKVEIVQIQHPKESWKTLDEMVNHVKELLEELELPYRILRLCGGDTGFASSMTYDFEIYSIAQKKWLEVSSVSNFSTFQANRLKLRFKNSDGKNQLCHTLNGSSLAIPRVLAGILENYQTDKGTLRIPKVLVPYTRFEEIS